MKRRFSASFGVVEIALICIAGVIGVGMTGVVLGVAFGLPWMGSVVGLLGGLWTLYWFYKIRSEPAERTASHREG